jgi:anaerobic magnesium-protoporphyrin IX monomethyl ester cyclase
MKIRLIEPEPPGMNVYSFVMMPRLGLPIMGSVLRTLGHDVLIYAPNFKAIDWNDIFDSDLVGISTTTSTATAGYEFADRCRARRIPVVMGGSHVTFMYEEALGHADYVARGEGGEALMPELIEALEGSRSLDDIDGLVFRRDGQTVVNRLRERVADLDELPFPDLKLISGHERIRTTPMMTSWGCPFDCNFCSVTAMFGKKYRFRSADSILAEIREKRPSRIFFYDDNIAAHKGRLKTLLRRMIDEDLVVPWSAQMRIDVTRDTELLDLMRRTKFQIAYLGLESIHQETLDRFDKRQTVHDVVRALRTFREHGLKTHGMFVLGADTDDRRTARDTVDFCMKNHVDTIQLNILTPLPGTPVYDELEAQGRIFEKRWHLYDAHHVVFTPKQMTPYELQRDTLRGFMRFYSLRQWLKYFFTFRFTKLLFQGWGWWIVRTWRKDERNKAFMRALKHFRWPGSEAIEVADPQH